ncbi:hypothetical protein [Streptomyces sp. Ncost-T10-10d]|uniref:hypothetical protein n=1 Tax=Streptomyces sp. Ncost-T10-10d TaxID=1839774 RepID=UPI00081E6F5E|nr:hypothetical protein [Streptomyces sp. Ncost-T10-10d]SCF97342.1 hypothetical protein GA0115254_1284117 [Streptomyces sp. Ncost-T10-10d]
MLRHAIAPSARYTKASHDVVRHPRLNSDAKVLLVYVQGLPEDATTKPLSELAQKLGIKGRAYQKAKQLLVEHGYVHEWRSQGGGGRWITEQLVANTPLTSEQAGRLRGVSPAAAPPPSEQFPTVGAPAARPAGGYEPVEYHSDKTTPHPPSEAGPTANPDSDPEPAAESADSLQLARAERLLLSLRHARRELHLGVREARALAVEAVKWLERGLSESDLRKALLAEPPQDGVRSAVGFLRYRLIQKLPEPQAPLPPYEPSPVRELLECEGPGEKHVFRPLADETECAPCRRSTAHATFHGAPAPEPDRVPWRERIARINRTSAALPERQ